jgi:uncharacterized protein (TIGR02118 family)
MIHQLIFAYPKPGMTEAEFQRYWLEVHAVNYASKIPQIRKYLIDTRVALPGETGDPLWSGVAEIWLENEKDQVESLQTKEFLQGARLDEPNWAAFWRTLVLDTDAHEVVAGPGEVRGNTMAKLIVLSKRREGLPRDAFRAYALGPHAEKVKALPGLRRYLQGHTRDGWYGLGEPTLDAAEQLWFDDVDAALAGQKALDGLDYALFAEPRYVHKLLVREHWVIGPEPRPFPART